MSLLERVYRVLIVSSSEKFNSALVKMLPPSRFEHIRKASSIGAAGRSFSEWSFDMVIINSPLPDDPGLRFAIDACENEGTIVLFVVRSENYSDVYAKLSPHGVFIVPKPISKQNLEFAISWMMSARERIRKLEKKTISIEDKMKEIRLVNRAKWLLIRELKMDEPAAHRYIEKQAMNRCVTRREIAEAIIRTYA